MARITEEMVRKRSEHNECEITTLEELSLHQQDIEKLIENLDRWCKRLKILYLQSNLISKIENVGRLKELEYLNLALNNVTRIENLHKCETLQKLDLTVNFVGDLLSIETLKENSRLQEMFLTGNPCTDYTGYRDFVIATLPQLKWLDGKEITKSERILALQHLPQLTESIKEQQQQYEYKVLQEKASNNSNDANECNGSSEEEKKNTIEYNSMEESVPYTPESRTALHKELSEKRQEGTETKKERNPDPPKRERRLERDGRMLNVNEGRYEFKLEENDEKQCYIVDVACPRFMDTSLIECDVQPTYVRVTIKGKILQLVLPEEVSPDASNALRSQITGHLVVTMPKTYPCIQAMKLSSTTKQKLTKDKKRELNKNKENTKNHTDETCNYLEVHVSENMLLIVNDGNKPINSTTQSLSSSCLSNDTSTSEDFIDDPDVPPLI